MAIQAVNQAVFQQEKNGAISGNGMTREDFLKLLIAQLQNQDPLKPLDNQEFATQLATFNSLDQLIGINEKLDTLQTKQLLLSQLGATSLIGKEVIAQGNKVSLNAGSETLVRYNLSVDAARVVVNLTDSNGNLVRALELGSQGAGEQTAVWDNKDSAGRTLTSGVYSFEVNAFDRSGKKIGVATRMQGVVTGLSLAGREPLLQIGGLEVPVSAVISVR